MPPDAAPEREHGPSGVHQLQRRRRSPGRRAEPSQRGGEEPLRLWRLAPRGPRVQHREDHRQVRRRHGEVRPRWRHRLSRAPLPEAINRPQDGDIISSPRCNSRSSPDRDLWQADPGSRNVDRHLCSGRPMVVSGLARGRPRAGPRSANCAAPMVSSGVSRVHGVRGARGVRGMRGVHCVFGVHRVHDVRGVRGVRGINGAHGVHDARGPRHPWLQLRHGRHGRHGCHGRHGSHGRCGPRTPWAPRAPRTPWIPWTPQTPWTQSQAGPCSIGHKSAVDRAKYGPGPTQDRRRIEQTWTWAPDQHDIGHCSAIRARPRIISISARSQGRAHPTPTSHQQRVNQGRSDIEFISTRHRPELDPTLTEHRPNTHNKVELGVARASP